MRAFDIHHHVLALEDRHSVRLSQAIGRVGPLSIEPPTHMRVADRLCLEVVNRQLSVRSTSAIWSRVEAAAVECDMAPWGLFVPEYEATLRACGLSGAKIRTLQAIRAADEAGWLGTALATLSHPERSEILCRIKGVGPWTADMIGIFHFGDPDIWPAGDVAAVGGLRRLTGCDDTQAIAATFAPYRSLLARYLWRIKDLPGDVEAPPPAGEAAAEVDRRRQR